MTRRFLSSFRSFSLASAIVFGLITVIGTSGTEHIEDNANNEANTCGDLGYAPGIITVGLADSCNVEECELLIEDYGLFWEDTFFDTIGVIQVPEGDEEEWIDILESEHCIRYAELDWYHCPH